MKKKFSFEKISKYRNLLMGIEIVLIILFHFTEDCKVYDVRYNGIVRFFYENIRSSGVDIFLLLSGLGLYYSWKRNPDYALFLRKRFSRIMIPYLLVATVSWGWRDFVFNGTGIAQFVKDVTFVSLFTQGVKWFWYIFMMAICYLVFPMIYNWLEKSKSAYVEILKIVTVFVVSTIFAWGLRSAWYEMYANTNILIYRFPMFVLGCWIGKLSYEKKEIGGTSFVASGAVVFLILSVLREFPVDLVSNYWRAFWNLAGCIAAIIVCDKIESTKVFQYISKVLDWCGTYSLELYLVHVSVRRVMNLLGFHTYRYSYEMIMLFLSVALSIMLKYVTTCIQKKMGEKNGKG